MWKRFNQRRIWWEATQTARSKPLDRKDAKSIRAENKVAKQISKHKSVKHIFQGIRILDPDRFQGAGEIDTIAIADNAIFVVEVKNWGWDIVRDGEDIAQERLLENGKKSEVIPKVNKKANDLTRWIRSLTNNCRLDIIPLVVLAHPKCKLSDDAKNLRTVTHIGDLHGKIDQLTPKSEKITSEEFDVICQTIEKFGRYDSISFDGGHIINGDFFELPFGWKRENVKSVEISILTSKWRSILLKPKLTLKIEKWDGKIEEQIIPLNGEAIAIKSPWEREKRLIPIEQISLIEFGNQGEKMRLNENLTSNSSFEDSTNAEHSQRKRYDNHKHLELEKGMVLEGKQILKHLKDDRRGNTYALLVEIIPKQVKGMLKVRDLDCTMDTFEFFYSVGKTIDVVISDIKPDGKIVLGINKT